MPGFAITPGQAGNQRNPPVPQNAVYTYTWDIANLVGQGVGRDSPLVFVRTCNLPQITFEEDNVDTGHVDYKFPKGVKWQDVKMSFYDTEGLKDVLKAKTDSVWTPEEGISPAAEFMADTTINVNFANNELAYSWILRNSWIKQLGYTELTYEASNVFNVNIVVGYHWAEQP